MKKHSNVVVILGILVFASASLANDNEQVEVTPVPPVVKTTPSVGPLLLGGLGVAMVAVGVGFGWEADQEYDNYNDNPSGSLADDVENHALAANILMFGGGAVIVSSFVWWLFARRNHKERGEPHLSTSWRMDLGPRRAGLTLKF